jgi:hypothetical protein
MAITTKAFPPPPPPPTLVVETESYRQGIATLSTVETDTHRIGERVQDIKFADNMRQKDIVYNIVGMRPNTTLIAYFDGDNVTTYCDNLTTDADGVLSGTFSLPGGKFNLGTRKFEVKDRDVSPTTVASAMYAGTGLTQTKQDTIMSVSFLNQEHKSIHETGGSPVVDSTPVINKSCPRTLTKFMTPTQWSQFLADVSAFLTDGVVQGGWNAWKNIIKINLIPNLVDSECVNELLSDDDFYCSLTIYDVMYHAYGLDWWKTFMVPHSPVNGTMYQYISSLDFKLGESQFEYIRRKSLEIEPGHAFNQLTDEEATTKQLYDVPDGLVDIINDASLRQTMCSEYLEAHYSEDPLAQSFFVEGMPGGCYVTSVDLYFKTITDTSIPVWVELREMENGYPSSSVIPMSHQTILSSEIISQAGFTIKDEFDAAVARGPAVETRITFSDPVYLMNETEYCVVVGSGSTEYEVFTAELGKPSFDAQGNALGIVDKPAHIGSMFQSQNKRTWTAFQTKDLMLRINRAKFNTGVTGQVNLWNKYSATSNDYYISTMMPTMEQMDPADTKIEWEVNFKEGSNEINETWLSVDNYANKSFDEVISLDLNNTHTSGGVPVWMRSTIETPSNNISPIVNLNRTGLVTVVNTGDEAYFCVLGGSVVNGITTGYDCAAIGGDWQLDTSGKHIGSYITKTVTLDDAAESVRVLATCNLETETDIQAYLNVGNVYKKRIEIDTMLDPNHVWETKYAFFYVDAPSVVSNNIIPDAQAFVNDDLFDGTSDRTRLYLINLTDNSKVRFGGYVSSADLSNALVWDNSSNYYFDDVVEAPNGDFYGVISETDVPVGVEPGVHVNWADYWGRIIITTITSNSVTDDPLSQQTGIDSGLIAEDVTEYLPMTRITSSVKAKNLGQAAEGDSNELGWVEYEFEPQSVIEHPFQTFSVKIVFTSGNLARSARMKNFRAMAVS